MSLFGKIARVASRTIRGGVKTLRSTTNIPVVGSILKATPLVGGALAAADFAGGLMGGTRSPGQLPMLPTAAATSGLPTLPGTAGSNPVVGQRGWFQNDPNIVAALQPFAISKANLRQSYRSPIKGFVIRYDSNGDPFAIPKTMARKYLGWKPSKKPPISVGDWEAVKRADRTVKKVRKVMTTMTRVDKAVGKGGKVKVGKKK